MKRRLPILYLLVVLAVAAVLYRQPEYNWDMLPYMAVAIEGGGMSVAEVHARTYQTAQEELPAADYARLVDSTNVYRLRTSIVPGVFSGELWLYRGKPLFIYSIAAAHALGVPLAKATVVPSLLGYIALAVVLLLWIRRILPEPFATSVALACILAPFFLQSARASTPDMLTAAFQLGGIYLIVEKRAALAGLLLLAASALVRLDAVLFLLVAIGYLFHFRLLSRALLGGIVVAVAVLAVLLFAPHPELLEQLLVIRSAAERLVNPDVGAFLPAYLRGARSGLAGIFYSSLAIVAAVGVATFFTRMSRAAELAKDVPFAMIMLAAVHIVLHFILHPSIEDRFFLVDYALVAIAAIISLAQLLYRRPPPSATPTAASKAIPS